MSGSSTTKGEEELTGRRRKEIGNDILLPVKSMVKFEHCSTDGGKEVTNAARATQMVDARTEMAVNIELGMTCRMVVVVYMQMESRAVRRVQSLDDVGRGGRGKW